MTVKRLHWHEFIGRAWQAWQEQMTAVDDRQKELPLGRKGVDLISSPRRTGGEQSWSKKLFSSIFSTSSVSDEATTKSKCWFPFWSTPTTGGASSSKADRQREMFQKLAAEMEAEVLFLDDLMLTSISDAMVVQSLFSACWERGMVLVITSNYAVESLYAAGNLNRDRFSAWACAKIPERCHVYGMDPCIETSRKTEAETVPTADQKNGLDYRELMCPAGRFLFPNTKENAEQFESLFAARCAENQDSTHIRHNVPLRISSSRSIVVLRCSNSVAQFSYTDLFTKNLGREEYSKILSSYKTVFIGDIPQLVFPDAKYEFARLAVFVDLAFRAKTELFTLGETDVREMYLGVEENEVLEDGLWAWKRTKSHLLEMNSEGWATR